MATPHLAHPSTYRVLELGSTGKVPDGESPRRLSALNQAMVLGEDNKPPTIITLFTKGVNETTKGLFLFDDLSAAAVMQYFKEYGLDKLPIDYNHAMIGYNGAGDNGKAAGWFTPAIINGDLVAQDIEWTPAALKGFEDREWRFYSPAMFTDWEPTRVESDSQTFYAYRILELVNFALTNLPATIGQEPLVLDRVHGNSNETKQESPLMEELLKALGATSPTDAVVKVHILLNRIKTYEETEQTILSGIGSKTIPEALAKVAQVRLANETAEKNRLEAEKKTLIDSLTSQGKVTPAQKDWFLNKVSLEDLKALSEVSPVVVKTENKTEVQMSSLSLDETQLKVAKALGVSPEAYAKQLSAAVK